MAIKIPTISELVDQVKNDVATEFGVDVSELGKSYEVWSKVKAGLAYQIYLTISRVQKNIYYDTAELEVLKRYGQPILGRLPLQATAGEYTVEVTGTIGTVIPASQQFIGADSSNAPGAIFVLDSEFTLSATTESITLRALESGLDSALLVNNQVETASPVAGLNETGVVTAISSTPTAAESTESYRDSIIQAAIIEPQGGSPGDFRLWSLEVGEVRTVYAYAKPGSAGDVDIYVEATPENTAPAEITGVPTQTTLDKVYLAPTATEPEEGVVVISADGKGRKPIGVNNINSLSIIPTTVDVNITGLSDESEANNIRSNIENFLYDIRPFVAGADILGNKNDTLTVGQISTLISQTLEGTGITFTDVSIDVDGVTLNSKRFTFGLIPYLRYLKNDTIII